MTKKSKDLLQELQDKYGDDILIREYPDGHPSVSTGSLAIDVSTGVGGIPVGRYTEIYGPEAGGKTTLCLSICKNALKLGIPVLYVDVEHSVDFPYVKAILGDLYDKKNILIVQPVTAEDAFDMAETGIDNLASDSVPSRLVSDKEKESSLKKKYTHMRSKLKDKNHKLKK